MRTSIFAVVVAASAVAFPAMAQQPGPQQAAPSEQTAAQMHRDQDATMKPSGQTSRQSLAPGQWLNGQTTGANAYGK